MGQVGQVGQVGRASVLVTRKLPSSVISKLSAVADVDLYSGEAAIPADELRARVADKDADELECRAIESRTMARSS